MMNALHSSKNGRTALLLLCVLTVHSQQTHLDAAVKTLNTFELQRNATSLQEFFKAYDALTESAHKTKIKTLLKKIIVREQGLHDSLAQQFREKFDADALKQEQLARAQKQSTESQQKIALLEQQLAQIEKTINAARAQSSIFETEAQKFKKQIDDLSEGARKAREFSMSERQQMVAMLTAQKQQVEELGNRLAIAEQKVAQEAAITAQSAQTDEKLMLAQAQLMVAQRELEVQTATNKSALAQLDAAQQKLLQAQEAYSKSTEMIEQLKKHSNDLAKSLEQVVREVETEKQRVKAMGVNASGISLTPGPERDAMIADLGRRNAEVEQLRQQVSNLQGQLSQQVVAIIEARAQGSQGAAEEIAQAQALAAKTQESLEERMRELDDLKRTVQASTWYVQGVDVQLAQAQAEAASATDQVQTLTKELGLRNQELAEARKRVTELDVKNSNLEMDVITAQRTAAQLAAQLAHSAAEKKLVEALTAARTAAEEAVATLREKNKALEAELALTKRTSTESSRERFEEAERIVAASEQTCATMQADRKQALRDRDAAREALALSQARIKDLESLRGDAQEAIRLLEQKDAKIKQIKADYEVQISNQQLMLETAVGQINGLEAEVQELRAENTLLKSQGFVSGK